MSLHLPRLPADPQAPFPDPSTALRRPEGLLAFGGDLTPERLLNAYANGIFPWYSDGQPILWWSPDPRAVFRTEVLRLPSRLRRALRRSPWTLRADSAFAAVIDQCATAPRHGQAGTWITPEMRTAYLRMHQLGWAHSVEVFDGDRLVGGIYGLAIGRMFFGESMYSGESGGSKVALMALAACLARWGSPLIDAQVDNPHLRSLGAELWPRARFLDETRRLVAIPAPAGSWRERFGDRSVRELANGPVSAAD